MTPEITPDIYEIFLLVLALLEVVFRITPSETDNSVFNKVSAFLKYIVDYLIPNRKRGADVTSNGT